MVETITSFLNNVLPLLRLVGVVLAAYLVVLWAATVLWTYRDIRMRSEDLSVQVLAVALVLLLPFGGLFLHLILRPPQTLAERYERTLEEEYLRRDIEERYVCPECQRAAEPDFLACPYCRTTLRRRCDDCERVLDLTWSICPYCIGNGSPRAATVRADAYPAVVRSDSGPRP
jgi:hypothetical protein